MKGFLIRGWYFILPGYGGTSMLARGETIAARWLHEPQSIAKQPLGLRLGFPHYAGWYRPGGSPFSSPGCRSCRCMEGFLIRAWNPTLHGICWLYIRISANQRSAGGAGVSTPYGAVSTRGNSRFIPGLSNLKIYERSSDLGMRNYPPRGALAL